MMHYLHPNLLLWIALLILLSWASFSDIFYRKIPNALILSGLLMTLGFRFYYHSPDWITLALGGGAGLLVYLPFFWKGVMGAGDVKLMMVVGLFLGWSGVFMSALMAALLGGFLVLPAYSFFKKKTVPYGLVITLGVIVYGWSLYWHTNWLL
jgi:Flp pilus assembly protein protease CpaA